MEYRIISGWSDDAVAKQVEALVAEGWRPQGGVAVAWQREAVFLFAQAMIRTQEEDKCEDR